MQNKPVSCLQEPEERIYSSRNGGIDHCEAPCVCAGEMNPSSLEEQPMLLTTEKSLQGLPFFLREDLFVSAPHHFGEIECPRSPKELPVSAPQCYGQGHTTSQLAFMWVVGIQTQGLMFGIEDILNTEPFPQTKAIFPSSVFC